MIVTNKIASLGKLVSSDEARPGLKNIRFEGDKAVACDGYILGVIKLDEKVKGERFVPGKLVAKKPKKFAEIMFSEKPEIRELKPKEGVNVTQYIEYDGSWPKTDEFIKEGRKNKGFKVAFSYNVLKKLVDAIGLQSSKYVNPIISMTFNKDNLKGVHMTVGREDNQIELVVMPAKGL